MKTAEDKNVFRNSETRYGIVAKSFHWLMAILIIAIFALGLYMVELSYYDRWYKDSLEIHKSTGLLIALLWLLRLAWKKASIAPKTLSLHAWETKIAHLAHSPALAVIGLGTPFFGKLLGIGCKRLEQVTPFLTRYILPAFDDRFQYGLGICQVDLPAFT